MQEQTTTNNLLHARQQIIELEETVDNDSPVGIFKRAAITAIDSHARLILSINNLVIKHDDQEQDLSKLFLINIKFFILVFILFSNYWNNRFNSPSIWTITKWKRKSNSWSCISWTSIAFSIRENCFRKRVRIKIFFNISKENWEFSAFWQQRFNDECDRLRQENAQLQNEYGEQTRSFTERLETLTAQNQEYLQVFTWNLFFQIISLIKSNLFVY